MEKCLHNRAPWLLPDWPAPARVHALCTTRAGGVSRPPYNALNLGLHVGDDASAVAGNRSLLQSAIKARPVFLSQSHGTQVAMISSRSIDGCAADASLSADPGIACTIMVADCLPVLLTNRRGSVVAAAHAGWRGLLGQGGSGILESTVAAMEAASEEGAAAEVLAWLGPCIGPDAFEVGSEVRTAFLAHDGCASAMFVPCSEGKWLADLPGLARRRLAALGVTKIFGNDGTRDWCTLSNPQHFFSHRRDRVSGRMAACIWLDLVAQ